MALKIFLSHSHDDRVIADALASLIEDVFDDAVSVSYSSDEGAGEGIPPGDPWLSWILGNITAADKTFVLLTPNSMQRPWVLWESGAASGVALGAGKETSVVPITFGLKDTDIPSPLASAQAIRGDSREEGGVRRLLQALNDGLKRLPAKALTSTLDDYVPPFLDTIEKTLKSAWPLESVLASIPPLFPVSKLEGLWATTYQFQSKEKLAHHADISRLRASADRRVRAINHASRTENHKRPFENDIEAELANRHLIGHWRNRNDTRYFGAVHLAVLSGECVMEGQYTSLANDVATNGGDWKWVKLDTAMTDEELKTVSLKHPKEVYDVLTSHAGSDGAIALDAILEKK